MISFQKGYLGLSTLLQAHGSAVPRTLIPALVSFILTLAMFYLPSHDPRLEGANKTWRHYFVLMMPDWKAIQIYASVTMFLLVFRTQVMLPLWPLSKPGSEGITEHAKP